MAMPGRGVLGTPCWGWCFHGRILSRELTLIDVFVAVWFRRDGCDEAVAAHLLMLGQGSCAGEVSPASEALVETEVGCDVSRKQRFSRCGQWRGAAKAPLVARLVRFVVNPRWQCLQVISFMWPATCLVRWAALRVANVHFGCLHSSRLIAVVTAEDRVRCEDA